MGLIAVLAVGVLLLQYRAALAARHRFLVAWHREQDRPAPGPSAGALARTLLDAAGLAEVTVDVAPRFGAYRPGRRTVLLDTDLATGASLAALAVAVHEVGHARQHRERPALVALGIALRTLAPLSLALALFALAVGLLAGCSPTLALGAIAAEAALALAVAVVAIEHDASFRGLRLVRQHNLAAPSDLAAIARLLDLAAGSYLALPLGAVLGRPSPPPPSPTRGEGT